MAIKQKRGGTDRTKPDVGAKLNSLPNTVKFAAETLKVMSERGGSAGSIVVNKYRNFNFKHIFAYVMNTVKNIKLIKKIIHETKLAKKVTTDDPFMLEILVGDLLFGKGLKSIEQNSTASSILGHKEAIEKQQKLLQKDYSVQGKGVEAKYLRINNLRSNSDHIYATLKTIGLKEETFVKEKIKFTKFISKFKSLNDNQFMKDFHFPDLIVLKPNSTSKLNKTDLFSKGKAMVQDKASYMAVEALDVQPGQTIIDACFAPGGKTSLIADRMRNKGKIIAYDVDKKRFLEAKHLLKVQGVTCVKPEVQDFSKVKLTRLLKTEKIDLFDSILIDPSCSGSGIGSRVDYKTSSDEAGRLKKLQAFQVALLKHALKAGVSKSIVYCTCSISVEENEQVVEMALNESGCKSMWDIVNVIPFWAHRGDENFEFGSKCLRSDARELTNGFFIAKFVRNKETKQT